MIEEQPGSGQIRVRVRVRVWVRVSIGVMDRAWVMNIEAVRHNIHSSVTKNRIEYELLLLKIESNMNFAHPQGTASLDLLAISTMMTTLVPTRENFTTARMLNLSRVASTSQ